MVKLVENENVVFFLFSVMKTKRNSIGLQRDKMGMYAGSAFALEKKQRNQNTTQCRMRYIHKI